MLKSIYRGLVIGIVLSFILSLVQNKELKTSLGVHKIKIEELYIQIDSLEKQVDSLVVDTELAKYNINRNDILEAIIFVESRNNNLAYAPSEDAVGCLQIRRVMVDDVNRILKRKNSSIQFTYNDRWDRKKSIEMFNIFITYYGFNTAEEMARGWNGGPRGINKSTTLEYWNRVEAELTS